MSDSKAYLEEKVKKACLRYIVPFTYEGSFEEACNNVDAFADELAPRFCEGTGELFGWKRIDPDATSGDGVDHKESDLFEYIRTEYSIPDADADAENRTGCAFELISKSEIAKVNNEGSVLPFTFNWCINSFKKNSPYMPEYVEFHVSKMGLYLFKNRLGFLWYELSIPEMRSNKLILFQNSIKELNRSGGTKERWVILKEPANGDVPYIKGVRINQGVNEKAVEGILKSKKPDYMIPFSFGDWIAGFMNKMLCVKYLSERSNTIITVVMNQLERETDYYKACENWREYIDEDERKLLGQSIPERVPDKAVLFSYVVFEPQNSIHTVSEDDKALSFWLTNGYKSTYHYDSSIGDRMLHPFSDILWYATKEGCSYIVWPSNDGKGAAISEKAGNSQFFIGEFSKVVNSDYFHLYIRCLYQSYSLLLFSELVQRSLSDTSELYFADRAGDTKECREKRQKNRKALSDIYTDINVFLARNMATSVSHIDHQSDFYIYLLSCLHIHADIKSLTSGLNALDSLIKSQMAREEKLDKEKYRQEQEERRAQEERDEAIERDRAEKEKKRSDDKIQAGFALLSILAIGSALVDTFDFIAKFGQNVTSWSDAWATSDHWMWYLEAFLFVVICIIGVVAIKSYFEMRKIVKRNTEEEKMEKAARKDDGKNSNGSGL